MLYKERGELEKALEQYQWVMDSNPKNVLALGNLGDCLMALDRYEEAIKTYKKALRFLPEGDGRWNIQNDLGVSYFKKGEMDKAIAEFKSVLKKNPDHVNAIYNLGQVYYHEGLTGRMKQDYEEFVKSSKNAASILFSLSKSMVSVAAAGKNLAADDPILIGQSQAMQKVQDLIKRAAASDATVLILGENGTGKELVARSVHQQSNRYDKPFIPIACSALSESLLESELFGHEKGAFTGAQYRKKGKFEIAEGGTVFLDEIGDISLKTQTDLLRVLQEREITRVGGNQVIKVDFRCVAATNKNLENMIDEGTFRPDLFYRLNVFRIELPALRERREDIPPLVEHFVRKFALAMSKHVTRIAPAAMDQLQQQPWMGNVRELENAVERAMVVAQEPELREQDFIFKTQPAVQALTAGKSLDEIERVHILRVLEECGGNQSRAADVLDIDRVTLHHKLKRYGWTRTPAETRN
jgi:DNA-binding NtrC family response regulator